MANSASFPLLTLPFSGFDTTPDRMLVLPGLNVSKIVKLSSNEALPNVSTVRSIKGQVAKFKLYAV